MTRPSPRLTAHDPDDAAFRVVEVVDIADADTLTSFVLDPGRAPWVPLPPPHQPWTAPPAGGGGSPTPGRAHPNPADNGDAPWTGDRADVARRQDVTAPARGRGLGGAPRARRRPGRHAIDAHASRRYRVTHGEVAVLAAVAGIVVCLIGVLIALSWQRARAADGPGLRPPVGSAPAGASQPAGPLEPAGTLEGVGVPSAHLAPTTPAPHGARPDRGAPAPGPGGRGPSGTDPEAALEADRAAARPGDPREIPAPPARANPSPPPPEPATEPAPAAAPNGGEVGASPPSAATPPAATSPQATTSPPPAATTSTAAAGSTATASSPASGVASAPATSPAAGAGRSATRAPAHSAPPAGRASPTRAPTSSASTPTSTGTVA